MNPVNKVILHTVRWLPALLMMSFIFIFSSYPSNELPDFGSLDYFIKKAGHILGYASLAISYHYALNKKSLITAWLLSLIFAATDEFHQSFVPGRHPTIYDIILFDNLGALLGLWIYSRRR